MKYRPRGKFATGVLGGWHVGMEIPYFKYFSKSPQIDAIPQKSTSLSKIRSFLMFSCKMRDGNVGKHLKKAKNKPQKFFACRRLIFTTQWIVPSKYHRIYPFRGLLKYVQTHTFRWNGALFDVYIAEFEIILKTQVFAWWCLTSHFLVAKKWSKKWFKNGPPKVLIEV